MLFSFVASFPKSFLHPIAPSLEALQIPFCAAQRKGDNKRRQINFCKALSPQKRRAVKYKDNEAHKRARRSVRRRYLWRLMLIFHLRQLYQRKNKTEVLSFIEPVPQNTKRFDTLPTQTKSIPLPSKPKTVPSLSTPEKSKPSSRLKTSHVMTGKDTKSVIALMKRVQIFTSLFGGMFLDVIFLMHKNGHLQFIC